jgi:glycosyltransferase involved in cell wall biosynthesis
VEVPIQLSIIIPCRGRQEVLNDLLDQLCAQIETRDDIEVIVIDDGSVPPLVVKNNCRVELLRHEQTHGAPAARESGMFKAKGRFIHFHDSDDLLGHRWLEQVLRATGRVPPPDFVVTSRLVVGPDGTNTFWPVSRLSTIASSIPRLRAYQQFINRIGPLGGVTFSRRAAEAIMFHRTSASQDWLMYDDALQQSREIYFDSANYFIFNKTQNIRISNNARARAKGYVFVANQRFRSRRMRKLAARLYCAHGARELAPVIDVRHRWLKRIVCEILARYTSLARQ